MRIVFAIAAVMLLAACGGGMTGETVKYTSSNFDFWRDAFAGKWGKPVTLEGRLMLPEGKGPFPVVVFQHGSGPAYGKHSRGFRAALRDGLAAEGIGLFIADSFTARNIEGTSGNQGQLSFASRLTDALRALESLAKHPRVDPDRIGISGLSAGGTMTIRSTHKPWADAVLTTKTRYAAGVALYPWCGSDFEQYMPTGAPLLMLLGEADNVTPHDACLTQADKMRKAGGKVETVVYPGAHHNFISHRSLYRSDIRSLADCPIGVQRLDGEVEFGTLSSEGLTYKEFLRKAYKLDCMRRGVTYGRNEAAALDSVERAVAFFAKHLK